MVPHQKAFNSDWQIQRTITEKAAVKNLSRTEKLCLILLIYTCIIYLSKLRFSNTKSGLYTVVLGDEICIMVMMKLSVSAEPDVPFWWELKLAGEGCCGAKK